MTTQSYIAKYCPLEWQEFYAKYKEAFELAPAATKHHHNFSGGLDVHTAEVIRSMFEIRDNLSSKSLVNSTENFKGDLGLIVQREPEFSDSDIVLAAFLHDFAKIVQYTQNEAGEWCYQDMTMPQETWTLMTLAQNELSISEDLTRSLLYAEGGFSEFLEHGYPNSLAWLLHMADIWSSQVICPLLKLPECPRCGKDMKKRNGARGAFWGCTAYPACSMTVNIES